MKVYYNSAEQMDTVMAAALVRALRYICQYLKAAKYRDSVSFWTYCIASR